MSIRLNIRKFGLVAAVSIKTKIFYTFMRALVANISRNLSTIYIQTIILTTTATASAKKMRRISIIEKKNSAYALLLSYSWILICDNGQ